MQATSMILHSSGRPESPCSAVPAARNQLKYNALSRFYHFQALQNCHFWYLVLPEYRHITALKSSPVKCAGGTGMQDKSPEVKLSDTHRLEIAKSIAWSVLALTVLLVYLWVQN